MLSNAINRTLGHITLIVDPTLLAYDDAMGITSESFQKCSTSTTRPTENKEHL